MGNDGGYRNVVMPFAAMVAVMLPISIEFVVLHLHIASITIPLVLLLEFVSLFYNPLGEKMLLASKRQREAGDHFVKTLQSIPGEVYLPFHGYIARLAGKPTQAHFMALSDALGVGDSTSLRLHRELDTAYHDKRFSAIIVDENRSYPADSLPGYSHTSDVFSTPNVFLSRFGDAATRPQFIYTPTP
jgi:hypothetical protein